jgi:hypothetical protein
MRNFVRTAVPALAVLCSALSIGCGKVASMLGRGDASAGESSGGLLGLSKDTGLSFLSGFEGEIDLFFRGTKSARPGAAAAPETINLSLFVKDKKFRMDLPNTPGPGGMPMKGFGVLDATQMKAFLVTDTPEKMAIVFDLNKTGEQLKGFSAKPSLGGGGGSNQPSKPPPKVTKTGRKDKVAGYECEEWEIVDDSSKANVCVAQQGFSWLKIPFLGAPAEYAWMGELLDGTHFPLRVIAFEKDGRESTRIEVTKIDKKALAANQFEIPPGYPQMTLDQMIAKAMSGFGAPGGRPPTGLPPGFNPGTIPGAKGAKAPGH